MVHERELGDDWNVDQRRKRVRFRVVVAGTVETFESCTSTIRRWEGVQALDDTLETRGISDTRWEDADKETGDVSLGRPRWIEGLEAVAQRVGDGVRVVGPDVRRVHGSQKSDVAVDDGRALETQVRVGERTEAEVPVGRRIEPDVQVAHVGSGDSWSRDLRQGVDTFAVSVFRNIVNESSHG